MDRHPAKSPPATYEARAAWCWSNQTIPVPSRLLNRAATTSVAAPSGIVTKPVRSERRRRASMWSGNGRTVAPSGGGAGSRAGAALSRATVQNRSATPVTNTVTSSRASAFSGVQSIHSGRDDQQCGAQAVRADHGPPAVERAVR